MDSLITLSPDPVQVMLDLETLGKKPGSVIVSIGAVKFQNGEIVDTFYEVIDVESSVQAGLALDASTVLWWMKQGDEARKEFEKPGKSIHVAIHRFNAWFGPESLPIWGNGADFDNVLLASVINAIGFTVPWKYFHSRCYRTLKNIFPEVPMEQRTGVLHNALSDAQNQASHLMRIFDYLSLLRPAKPIEDNSQIALPFETGLSLELGLAGSISVLKGAQTNLG